MKINYKVGYDENGKWFCVPRTESAREIDSKINVIFDEMSPTLHPCNQKIYTSKAKFRETTKAHGKEEVGNEYNAFIKSARPEIDRTPVAESISNAFDFLMACEGKSEGEKREMEARFYNEG